MAGELAAPRPEPLEPVDPRVQLEDRVAALEDQVAELVQRLGRGRPPKGPRDEDYDSPPVPPAGATGPGRDPAGQCTVCKVGPAEQHSEACPFYPAGGYPPMPGRRPVAARPRRDPRELADFDG